jgi:hypothetical protein
VKNPSFWDVGADGNLIAIGPRCYLGPSRHQRWGHLAGCIRRKLKAIERLSKYMVYYLIVTRVTGKLDIIFQYPKNCFEIIINLKFQRWYSSRDDMQAPES